MSTTPQSVKNGTDSEHCPIDHERFERALTEEMAVETIAPGMLAVTHNGETRTVDLVGSVCDCPDSHYRHVICKHLLSGALTCLDDDSQQNTQFVARVARFARKQGCVEHRDWCEGPVGTGTFPCPTCVVADEWTVWCRLIGPTGAHR